MDKTISRFKNLARLPRWTLITTQVQRPGCSPTFLHRLHTLTCTVFGSFEVSISSIFSYHFFPVPVGQKLEDPLEDFCWQCAVDAPCSHFGLTLLKFNLSGFMKGFFLRNKMLNLFVSVEKSSDSGVPVPHFTHPTREVVV